MSPWNVNYDLAMTELNNVDDDDNNNNNLKKIFIFVISPNYKISMPKIFQRILQELGTDTAECPLWHTDNPSFQGSTG